MRELFERYLDADLDDLDATTSATRFWERIERIPAAELWEAHVRPEARARRLRPGAAAGAVRPPRRGAADPPAAGRGARPEGPDHRLRPPVRDVQARRAALHRRGAPGAPAVQRGPPGPDRVRGQGAPGRPARPAVIQDIFGRTRVAGVPRPRVHPRGLRHARSGASWSRASTSGSTTRAGRWRRRARRGMKAAMNGVVNCSVLDGWWDEGFNGDNGWAIGGREQLDDEGAQDWADAQDLYRLLESETVPELLRARRRRAAAALGRAHAPVDRDDDLAVLDHADAPGVRRAAVPARGGHRGRSGSPQSPNRHDRRIALALVAPQPPAGRQLRLGLRRGLRAGVPCPWSTRSSAIRSIRVGLHYTGPLLEWMRPSGPASSRPARAVERGQVEILGGGLYEPSWRRCRSATGSASWRAWPRRRGDVRRRALAAPGWPSGSGSRTCRPRSRPPAIARRSWMTSTFVPPLSPTTRCGARTRRRTRAG